MGVSRIVPCTAWGLRHTGDTPVRISCAASPHTLKTGVVPVGAEELEMLANDMDVERNGYIPLEEFKDVLVRRQDGYDFTGRP